MIKFKLTGIRKISGHESVMKSSSMATITATVDAIISSNFDNKPDENYILLESVKITIEVER